jgi:Zn-dependent M28 family amino/carboxypeptidase
MRPKLLQPAATTLSGSCGPDMNRCMDIVRDYWITACCMLALVPGLGLGACTKTDSSQPPASPTSLSPARIAVQPTEADPTQAAQVISPDFIRQHIATLSDDALQGRAPATPGDAAARAYLIEQLRAIGLMPGQGDRWEQPFDVVSIRSRMPAQWTFERGNKRLPLAWHDQYIANSGVHDEQVSISKAEVVFVGYGIQAPEYGWDDFKGQDLKGKVLLMLNNDPDWDPELFAGKTRLYYGRWSYKYESAARQGAAGAIVIHTTPSAGYPFGVLQTSASGAQFELPSRGEARSKLEGWLTEDAARALAALAGQSLDALVEAAKSKRFEPVPFGVTTSIAFANQIEHSRTANVFGVLAGSDPVLRNELVVYTAHHDHLGVGTPDAEGDAIYNGALDNAAGVAQLLAIAKAFRALPVAPKRSVMFLFVGGEEQGLLGSRYFAAHPTIPAGRLAANLNYDSGNIWGRTRDVTFVGMGKSSLDAIVRDAAARQKRTVKPDQFPDRGFFYRSDQFSFAQIGVPAVFLGTGTDFVGRSEGWGKQQIEAYEEHHYHQPSDELQPSWQLDGMVEDAQLGFLIGLEVANGKELPRWVPGDEFEAARKAALAALADQPNR